MFLLSLLMLAFVLWVAWYLATQFYEVAQAKGYHDRKYFWICFWFALPGYLLVIALPNRSNALQTMSDELPDL